MSSSFHLEDGRGLWSRSLKQVVSSWNVTTFLVFVVVVTVGNCTWMLKFWSALSPNVDTGLGTPGIASVQKRAVRACVAESNEAAED